MASLLRQAGLPPSPPLPPSLVARLLPHCGVTSHRVHDCYGVAFSGRGTKGRLVGCEIWGNDNGVRVEREGDPTLVGCTIRDHADGDIRGIYEESGCGVFVDVSAYGKATCTDCVFARNASGDIVGPTRCATARFRCRVWGGPFQLPFAAVST